jgi:hypothetical protein
MSAYSKLTREQHAVTEFLQASEFMQHIADDKDAASLLEFTDNVILAIAAFGTAELHARQAERCAILNQPAARAKLAMQQSVQSHKKGLTLAKQGQEALKGFRTELKTYPKQTITAKSVDSFVSEFQSALVDLELKPSDVEKIDKIIRTCLDEIGTAGIAALPDYLSKHLEELVKLRSRDDRGAVENIPLWKVAAIAVAVGVFIWAFFRCGLRRCSLQEGLTYAVIFWISALIARFC